VLAAKQYVTLGHICRCWIQNSKCSVNYRVFIHVHTSDI